MLGRWSIHGGARYALTSELRYGRMDSYASDIRFPIRMGPFFTFVILPTQRRRGRKVGHTLTARNPDPSAGGRVRDAR